MTLSIVDGIIIACYLIVCVVAGVWMRRYIRGVDDFAVAGREMDLNLGVASLGATEMGLVTVIYTAQLGFTHGPAGATVGLLMALAMVLVGMSGFIIGPLRDAGVLTIPELFEKRFGKRVRWLAGFVMALGGILNMGIFLRLGGEFLMRITGMDVHTRFALAVMGSELQLGYLELTMTALLGVVLLYTVLGGMVSVLVTDYLQFLVMGAGIVITSLLVLDNVGWWSLRDDLDRVHRGGVAFQERQGEAPLQVETLQYRAAELADQGVLVVVEPGRAPEAIAMGDPVNPFAATGLGWRYVLWQALFQLAAVTTWQTMISRVLSTTNSATSRRMYCRTAFYFVGRFALPGLWGAAAFLHFSNAGGLPEGVTTLTAMPEYLKTLLPAGLIGLLIAAMLAAEMSTDSSYLLSWATVIYNDMISPCLRRPLSATIRLLLVRSLVLAIGAFLLIWGLWYEIPGRAWDYLAVTGTIYLASLFTLLVSGLYWQGANRWGAMAAIVLGSLGPVTFLVVNGLAQAEMWGLDASWMIPPEIAGLAAFAMSFSGMVLGSWLGRSLGYVGPHTVLEN